MSAVMNTSVSGGAAALLVSAQAPAGGGATAEGFSKAMRAAELLQGVKLPTGGMSSAKPGPDMPTPLTPQGSSLWNAAVLGQASAGSTTAAGTTAEISAQSAGQAVPVTDNLLLIQQLTSGAKAVPAAAVEGAAVEGAPVAAPAAADVPAGSAGATVMQPLQVADNLLLIQQQASETPSGTTTPAAAVTAGTAGAATGHGEAAAALAALAGSPGRASDGKAMHLPTPVTPAGSGAGSSRTVPVGSFATPAATNPVLRVRHDAGAAAVVPPAGTAAAAATSASAAVPVQTMPMPGAQAATTAAAAATTTTAATAATATTAASAAAAATTAAAKTANANNGREQATAPVAAPAPTSAAPSSPVSAPAPAAPAPPPAPAPLATQVGKPMLQLAAMGNGDHTVTLNVSPDNLGQVTVRAQVGADGIRVDLFAATDSGREALKAILGELRRDLAGMGGNSSLNLSGDGQPGAFGGRGFGEKPQHTSPGQSLGSGVPEPEPDAPRPGNSTSTLDLLA